MINWTLKISRQSFLLFLLFLLSCLLSLFAHLDLNFDVQASLGTSTSPTATANSFQRKTFYDDQNDRQWSFFHDGSEIDIQYSTNDGSSWTSITSLAYDTSDFSVWYMSIGATEYVWLAVASGNDILVRQGTLSATSITWDSDVSVALNGTGASDDFAYPYITLDSSNYLWVGARHYDGTNYFYKTASTHQGTGAQMGTADPVTYTWTATPHQINGNQTSANVFGTIVPLSAQDMYATFSSDTALQGCVWDHSDTRWEDSAGSTCSAGVTLGGGMLVYSDRASNSDAMSYKILDSAGNWGTAGSTADVDAGTTDRGSMTILLFSDPTSSEKILLSTHFDGSVIYLYAQVWDGSSWGNVELLSSWADTSLVSRWTKGGDYLNNGDFMAVYSDGTNTPKFSTWNGTSWNNQDVATQSVGGIVSGLVAKVRPGTNEMMVITVDTDRDTNSLYYDGSGYTASDWTLLTPELTTIFPGIGYFNNMDFTWSENSPTRGAIIYEDTSDFTPDNTPNINIFTADGLGGGSWGTMDESINLGDTITRPWIVDRPGSNEFLMCAADDVSDINCFEENDNDTTPTLQTTTNGEIEINTDTGNPQRPFGLDFEQSSADLAIAVYTDRTAVPKLKKYDPSTNTWDVSSTSLANVTEAVETIDVIPDPNSDDIAIMVRTTGSDCHTVFWDGSNNAVYATGDRAMTEHATTCGIYTSNHAQFFAWDLNGPGSQDSIDTVPTGVSKNLSSVSDGTNYDVHLTYVDDEATDQISYKRWDSATVSWDVSPVNLDASATNAYPTLSIDTTTNDLYAAWIDTSNSHIYYRSCDVSAAASECSTSGDWITTTDWKTTGTNAYLTSNYSAPSKISAMWADGGSSPYSIQWDLILGSSQEIPSIAQLMRHGSWFNSAGIRQLLGF